MISGSETSLGTVQTLKEKPVRRISPAGHRLKRVKCTTLSLLTGLVLILIKDKSFMKAISYDHFSNI